MDSKEDGRSRPRRACATYTSQSPPSSQMRKSAERNPKEHSESPSPRMSSSQPASSSLTADATSSRKRHSPNTGAKKETSTSSSSASGAAAKQRRVHNHNKGSSSQPTSSNSPSGAADQLEVRLTRSRARHTVGGSGSTPASPQQVSPLSPGNVSGQQQDNVNLDAVASPNSSATVARGNSNPAKASARSGGSGKKNRKASSASAAAADQQNQNDESSASQDMPETSSASAAPGSSHRVFPSADAAFDAALAALHGPPQPASSHVADPAASHASVVQHHLSASAASHPYQSAFLAGMPASMAAQHHAFFTQAAGSSSLAGGMLLESMAAQSAAAAAAAASAQAAAAGAGAAHRTVHRSAASAFIGNLVPRMQHLLGGAAHRDTHANARLTAIMDGLRSQNEIRQAEAATELAEMLLMGNEDSLPQHLPLKEMLNCLVQLLQKDHNFELMLTAARCLTNMLEALPRAQPIVVEAVPYLLDKLKRIECIDVAEQSLTALEVMSRRNGKTIMSAGGIAATISHVDFFSLASQRLAFAVAANCALFLSSNDFPLVRDSLPELTQRLLIEDKRCLDSVCLLFTRLVDNMKNHPDRLREMAGQNHRLLSNVQQVVVAQPCLLSSNTFPLALRMLRLMAAQCSDLAVALISIDFAGTLKQLFVGSSDSQLELVDRPPNQLLEMVQLTGELLPRLPSTGMFEIDSVWQKGGVLLGAPGDSPVMWYWKDDHNGWQSYRNSDARVLEAAKVAGEDEVRLDMGVSRLYRVDLVRMTQENLTTGMERQVQRRVFSPAKPSKSSRGGGAVSDVDDDKRVQLLKSEPERVQQLVAQLLPVLVEIDASSSGPALRLESLRVMLRMVCPLSASALKSVLAPLPLSGHIASALASPRSRDLPVVVSALQLVRLLLEKLSDIYAPLFRKEGVAHEIAKLAATLAPVHSAGTPSTSAVVAEEGEEANEGSPVSRSTRSHRQRAATAGDDKESKEAQKERERTARGKRSGTTTEAGSSGGRNRKRSSPESSPAVKKEKEDKKESKRKSSSTFLNALRLPSFSSSSSRASPSSSSSSPQATPPPGVGGVLGGMLAVGGGAAGSSGQSARARLHHFMNNSAAAAAAGFSGGGGMPGSQHLSSQQKERLREWIGREASVIMKTYLSSGEAGQGSVVECLQWVAEQLSKEGEDVGTTPLTQLYAMLDKDDVSSFELTHSGLISALHCYLASEREQMVPGRRLRLKRFASVFMHVEADHLRPASTDSLGVLETMVQRLLGAVAQLEQFQVKVSDMGGISTGGSGGASGCLRGAQALKFFQSHQIRCNLRRHPDCRQLKDWRHGHGSIKVDPLTSISAIERYLLDRGIGFARGSGGGEESSGDDDISDEEQEGMSVSAVAGGEERRIEILIGDHAVPGQMSVLQALRQYSPVLSDDHHSGSVGAGLWMNTHTLFYRAATSAAPEGGESSSASGGVREDRRETGDERSKKEKKHKCSDKVWIDGEVPRQESALWEYVSLSLPQPVEDASVPVLLLLRAIYGLSRHWWALFEEEEGDGLPTSFQPLLPASVFHSSKLAAKLSRQLSDFLSVATQQIPKWTGELVNAVPFLFPFALRRSLLYCTAFGRERALMHLVSSQTDGAQGDGDAGRLTTRLERRRIAIKRDELLKSAEAALLHMSNARALLEVSFEGEAGTGFGPTLEFYSTVCRELQAATHKLWHGATEKVVAEDGETETEYYVAGHGLFPTAQPHSGSGGGGGKSRDGAARVKRFEMMGRLMGQALVDARILDLPLSPVVLRWLCGEQGRLGVPELEMIDPEIYSSMRQLVYTDAGDFEHLEQYFTLPGNESVELVKGGRNKAVTRDNAMQFIRLVAHWRVVEGVWREMDALRRGFAAVVDPAHLRVFEPHELDELFCGCKDADGSVWSESALLSAIKPDHGYSHESEQIKWLVKMLSGFSLTDQRRFVQFVTGSPRLPVGGWKALAPPLTVVKKTAAYGAGDEELPSAMTCYNYLKVPAYSSPEVFRERFEVALRYIYSFHLT